MKVMLVLVGLLAFATVASACSQEAQDRVGEALETGAPTLQAAADEAGTQVAEGVAAAKPTVEAAAQGAATEISAGMATAAPTIEAAGTAVAEAVDSTMAKLVALGTVWEWQGTLMNDDTERVPEDPSLYTLDIKLGKELAIQADCNSATATYEEGEDGQVTITMGAMTLAACPEGSLADDYLADLGNVGSAMMDGDDLILLLKMDSGSMRFSPAE